MLSWGTSNLSQKQRVVVSVDVFQPESSKHSYFTNNTHALNYASQRCECYSFDNLPHRLRLR